ncbi:MAG: hypothetical protein GX558_06265, partial [Clostridiales bacterium]|nr:hypothetical protein [Clostridiales bacterium]
MSNLGYREIANLGPLGIKQLNDTLRALWAKVMGNIELRDLDREVKSTIAGKADSGEVETLSTLVRQTAGELALKASLTAVDELGDRVAGAETALTLKADQAALTSAVGGLQSQLNLVPGQITAAVESIDELHAGTSVTITPAEGLVVDQYLPGNGGVPFQTRIAADRFGVYRAPDGAAIMAAGADADGTGYVAVNRLRDPQVDNGMYVRVYNRAAGDGSFWGGVGLELVRIREGAHEVMGQWGYLADAEAATAMHLRRRGALLELGAGGANGVRQVSTDIDAQPMANQEADEVVIESLTGVEGGVLPGYSAAGALDGYQLQLHVRRYVDGEWIYSQDGRWPRLLMRNRERDAGGNPGGVPNIMLGVGSGSNLARILMAPTADGNSGRITLTGMTVPAASSSYDLGTSSQRWRYIYLNNSP